MKLVENRSVVAETHHGYFFTSAMPEESMQLRGFSYITNRKAAADIIHYINIPQRIIDIYPY